MCSLEEENDVNELGRLGRSKDRYAWVSGAVCSHSRAGQWGRERHGGKTHHWSSPRMTMNGRGWSMVVLNWGRNLGFHPSSRRSNKGYEWANNGGKGIFWDDNGELERV